MPDIPVGLDKACRDAILTGDYVTDIADHRLALAECRRRYQRLVDFYNDLKAGDE